MLLPLTRSAGRHRAEVHARHTAAGAATSTPSRPGATAAMTVAALATVGGVLPGPALADAPGADGASTDTTSDGPDGSDPVEESPAAKAAHAEARVPGTPCSVSARACVDLESQRAWLIEDGEVTRGPMVISSGGEGEETPVGHSFRVYRQDEDHVSGESRTRDGRPAPMPSSTFFADGGIAFHAGDPARSSAGCVRMETADAEAVFDELRRGDKVQVVDASDEDAARARVNSSPTAR